MKNKIFPEDRKSDSFRKIHTECEANKTQVCSSERRKGM